MRRKGSQTVGEKETHSIYHYRKTIPTGKGWKKQTGKEEKKTPHNNCATVWSKQTNKNTTALKYFFKGNLFATWNIVCLYTVTTSSCSDRATCWFLQGCRGLAARVQPFGLCSLWAFGTAECRSNLGVNTCWGGPCTGGASAFLNDFPSVLPPSQLWNSS